MLHPEDWTAEWIGDDIIGNTLSTTVDGCYWIWSLNGSPFDQAPAGHHYFRKTFSVNPNKTVKQVIFGFTADDQGVFYLNGEKIGQTQAWESGGVYDLSLINIYFRPKKSYVTCNGYFFAGKWQN